MTDLPASLADSASRWPHPAAELERAELRKWILQHCPKGGAGAEIGTFRGHFAEAIARRLKPRRLYLIDPWALAGETTDGGIEGGPVMPSAAARQEAAWRLAAYPGTETRLVDGWFPKCAPALAGPLDFVYLGACLGFAETRQQLRAAERLLWSGGLLLGDGWCPDPKSPRHGVFRAVNLFARNQGFDMVAAGPHGQWAIRRREEPRRGEADTESQDDERSAVVA